MLHYKSASSLGIINLTPFQHSFNLFIAIHCFINERLTLEIYCISGCNENIRKYYFKIRKYYFKNYYFENNNFQKLSFQKLLFTLLFHFWMQLNCPKILFQKLSFRKFIISKIIISKILFQAPRRVLERGFRNQRFWCNSDKNGAVLV